MKPCCPAARLFSYMSATPLRTRAACLAHTHGAPGRKGFLHPPANKFVLHRKQALFTSQTSSFCTAKKACLHRKQAFFSRQTEKVKIPHHIAHSAQSVQKTAPNTQEQGIKHSQSSRGTAFSRPADNCFRTKISNFAEQNAHTPPPNHTRRGFRPAQLAAQRQPTTGNRKRQADKQQ